MKKIIITSFSVCLLIPFMKAQEVQVNQPVQEKKETQSMGGGGLTIGYGYMDVSKFQAFVPASFEKFNNQFFVIGGTGHGMVNKFVIGGSGFGIIGSVIKTDSLKASLGGGIGTFDFGYLILNKDQAKIYPMIGIGGGGFGLQISKNKNVSAADVANNPGREINISHGNFVADLSLNLNFIPSLQYDEKNNSYGGFMTGLKIGYIYSMPSSDWRFTGGDVTGGPSFGLNMFYVKLIVGGFGYQKKS